MWEACLTQVKNRIATAQQALDLAKEASLDDTKSSAGDKYETTREMMRQEIDRNERLLREAEHLQDQLEKIPLETSSEIVQLGSLITTDKGKFYLSISLGTLKVNGIDYWAVSSESPIGHLLKGKKKGDRITFNQRDYTILQLD